ncbi:hypothetical protein O6H91_17G051900 [Diphasiastrum complanatum]|nr:hypothetical protein O6H91_17G051900 [Diphasiastrum complanatum]
MALKLKEVLAKEKAHVMSLNDLGKLRKKMGVSRTKRFASFAASYPRVFNINKDKDSVLWMEFTDEVEDLLEEEEQFRKHVHEPWVVGTLQKLLMLSADRRLAIDKVGHLKHELGLPDDFRTNLVHKYPQCFKVLDNGGSNGPLLELADWDPSLAITARERKIKEESCEFDDLIGENTGYGFRIDNPKGYTLRKKQREVMACFQTLPFPSPYEDASGLGQNSLELEKRTVALVHEFLSLTLRKRAVVNHILHFRKEFRLPQRMLALLLRHQGIFYVSLKGDIHTLFLKEAYEGSTLKEKNPLLDFNSRLGELCRIRKVETVGSNDAQILHGQKDKEGQDHLLANNEKVHDNDFDDKEDSGEDEFTDEEESGEDDKGCNEQYADLDDGLDDPYTESSTDLDDIRP